MSRANRLRLEPLEAREVPATDLAYAIPLTGLPADVVTRVAADPAGNVYVTGTFSGTIDLNPDPLVSESFTARGASDVFVAKYGINGQLLWATTTDGAASESAGDIAIDGIGNVFVAGTFTGAVDFDPDVIGTAVKSAAAGGSAFVWKLDSTGAFFNAMTIDGVSTATSLDVDTAGNTFVIGRFYGTADFNPSSTDTNNLVTTNSNGAAYAWKLDATGAYTWALPFETTGSIVPAVAMIDNQGFAYISGQFTGTADLDPATATKTQIAAGIYATPFVAKLGVAGDLVWARAMRVISQPTGTANAITGLGVDGIGNVYAAGTFAGSIDFDPGAGNTTLNSDSNSVDGFAWKLDFNGTLGYARRFGGAGTESVSDGAVDGAGNFYTTGTFTGVVDFDPGAGIAKLGSGSGAADTFVLKLNQNGNLAYTRSLGGGASTTRSSGIFPDGAGNMYITGGFSGQADFEPWNPRKVLGGGNGSGFIAKLWPPVNAPIKPNNLPPRIISTGGPYTIQEANGITVKGEAVDPEGVPLIYNWDLNGDGIWGDAFGKKVTLTPVQMSLLGLIDGTGVPRTVRLRINDGVNLQVDVSTTLTIQSVAPTIKLIAPTSANEGVRPEVSYKIVFEPVGKDIKAGFRASWDFNDDGVWDLGNGSTYAGSVTGATVKIPAGFVNDSGPLAVRVRVFDKDGAYSEKSITIMILEKAPKATFGALSAPTPGAATFQFTNPIDSANDVAAGFTYAFDFDNDGVYEVSGNNPQATVTFPAPGPYVVHGKIIDQDGAATTYELVLEVSLTGVVAVTS